MRAPRELYFGADIQSLLEEWWREDYLPNTFHKKYGFEANVAVAVFETRVHLLADPRELRIRYLLTTGEGERFDGEEGLITNVFHKYMFVSRTGLDSVLAHARPDLLESGDFPWQGAGIFLNYRGGASGLEQEQDWDVFCDVVKRLQFLRKLAAEQAVLACQRRVEGWKYLEAEGLPPSPEPDDEPIAG